ncbi:lipase family protein [Nocardia sp. NPDC051463]|uniref:lipase family protein n=1 Tax=Nocardia sp. NPDC051463 TaxID=3154845 RepID=UPI00344D9C65
MRLPWTFGRTAVAVVAAAGVVLGVTSAPAGASEPGEVLSAVAQADGWHGMSGGSVIEYWMRGSDGTPRPASGALFVPAGAPPAGGWPVMAFDHGTTGLGAGCGGQADPASNPFQRSQAKQDQMMRHMVGRGIAVVAPDYLGLGRFDTGPHPYLEIGTEATATIDLVRAARTVRPELSRTWGVIGASQGGQAALGAGHLQASYAPDLDFRGAIAIDPESDVEKVLPLAGPAIPAIPNTEGVLSFYVSILAGLREARPDLDVNGYLTPLGRSVLDDIGTECLDTIIARVRGLGVGELMARPLSDERMRAALDAYMTVPTSGYDAPILLLLNATDTVVPSPLHAALVAQFVANRVDFQAVVGTGKHTQLNPQMSNAIDEFLARIFAVPSQG